MPAIRCVIFDLDGTLADSARLTQAALARECPALHLPVPSPGAIREAMGYSCPAFYFRLFPELERARVLRCAEAVERAELELLPALGGGLLFGGCRELLEELHGRGIRLCIASTGSREHVEGVLAATGIERFFQEVSCDEPEKVGMVRQLLGGGDPARCLMVGDKVVDAAGARQNNVKSVGALYGYCRPGAGGFDHYIEMPLELLGLLVGG